MLLRIICCWLIGFHGIERFTSSPYTLVLRCRRCSWKKSISRF